MKRWTAALEKMTLAQRQKLAAELTAFEARPTAVTVVEGRLASVPACPHCAAERVVKNGTARGLQRYKCRGCDKTFCALTGTPLAGLHMRGKWIEQAAALRDGLTLHKVAERLNIAVSTAHRWRHRFLSLPKAIQARALVGIAEADETYFLRSNKGQRKGLGRQARKRGGKASKRGLSSEQVPVLVARDRAGSTADFILEADDSAHIVAALKPLLAKDAIFCSDGSKAMAAAARTMKVVHRPVNLSAGIRVVAGVYHVQNVNAYDSRLKDWLRQFRGVATKYLDSYLGWFRTIERSPTSGLKPAQWLALAVTR
jgi:transposase-like protein